MTFWHVVTKFFDSGKVKVNLAPIEVVSEEELYELLEDE